MKPATPILRNEHYLDVMTGGSASLPSPILREERYLAKLAGMEVSIPIPVTIKEKYYAKICGMDVDVPTYTRNMPRIYAYMAKAAGQTIEDLPTAVTREQRYWYDYVSEPPVTEHEYTGAVPYTFTANGEPLLDWSIYGNTVQSTTPTPDNPVMPNGTGERTGNLFDEVYSDISGTIRYRPIFVGDGTFTLSTTTPYDSGVANVFLLSGNVSSGASTLGNGAWKKHNVTAQSVDGYVTIAYRRYSGTTSPVDCQTMLNTGSAALPYEPYGYKIPISSASTTTPVYLGEVETTRQIKKVVYDGTESWSLSKQGNNTRADTPQIPECLSLSPALCTHFDYNAANVGYPRVGEFVINSSKAIIFGVDGNTFADVNAWKSYLAAQYAAGTPVCVWYVLTTPETAVVNEPLRKIGEYADTLSMEQADVNIPTNNGSTTIDVETTLKPSEVYIKWKGAAT